MIMEKKVIKKLPSSKEIINVVYEIASACYGIKGFTRFDSQVTGKYEPLKIEDIKKGIIVRKYANGLFSVDLYVLLADEVKLTETLSECQKVVRYKLNKNYNNQCRHVNVYAMSVVK